MRPIIYNLNSIRAPITGIGRYAIELITAARKASLPVSAFTHGRLLDKHELDVALAELDSKTSQNVGRWRGWLGTLPYTRDLYRWRQQRSFEQARSVIRLDEAIQHDINYSNAHAEVVTIYDLSHIICPETHPKHRVKFLHRYFNELLKFKPQILTISNQVKAEILEQYNLDPKQVSVTRLAADPLFKPRPSAECQSVLDVHKLSFKKFILCLGTREPRKNLKTVLKAYSQLPSHLKSEYPIAIAGPKGWKNDEVEQAILRLRDSGELIDLGFVAQNDLPALYSAAAVFVFPSLYEGFGLPLLEAMQSGCACITSNYGALAEVASDSASLVDPLDHEQITHELIKLLENVDYRQHLSTQAIHRASKFTWTNTAKQTFEAYASLS